MRVRVIVVPWLPFFGAFSLWSLIVVQHRFRRDVTLMAHELGHVDQFAEYPLTLPFRALVDWVRVGFSYSRHPLEVEARERAWMPSYRRRANELIVRRFG